VPYCENILTKTIYIQKIINDLKYKLFQKFENNPRLNKYKHPKAEIDINRSGNKGPDIKVGGKKTINTEINPTIFL
jgi:hypothetical protein